MFGGGKVVLCVYNIYRHMHSFIHSVIAIYNSYHVIFNDVIEQDEVLQ